MIKTKINVKFERERERVNGAQKLENRNLLDFGQKIILTCLLVFIFGLGAKASAATLANPEQWQYQKKINITGTGSAETDYITNVNLHYGSSSGDTTAKDVFLDSHAKTDFSDVRITDSTGNLIPFYLTPAVNAEMIYSNTKTGYHNVRLADGSLLAYGVSGQAGIVLSTDNGNTWTQKFVVSSMGSLLFVDSRGYWYWMSGNLLKRSTDGVTSSTVLDIGSNNSIQWIGMTEDNSHNLWVGQYTSDGGNRPSIRKSTDGGANFNEVLGYTTSPAWQTSYSYVVGDIIRPTTANSHLYYVSSVTTGISSGSEPSWPTTTSATVVDGGVTWKESSWQHIHGIGADPYTGNIYFGFDGEPAIVKSTDGTTFKVLRANLDADVTQMAFAPTYRLFGSGASAAMQGESLLKANADDSIITAIFNRGQDIQGVKIIGSTIVISGVSYDRAAYPAIYVSTDGGTTFNMMTHYPFDSSLSFSGYEYFDGPYTPAGASETAIFAGGNVGTGSGSYPNGRIYVGSNHYQGEVYLKIPSLPAGGKDFYVWYGNSSATSTSDVTMFPNMVQNTLVARWKMDEGSGTSVVDSCASSGASCLETGTHNGTLTHTSGKGSYNAFNGRRSGMYYPDIKQSGASYNFNAGDYVEVADHANLQMVKNFTVTAWIRGTNLASNQCIICKGSNSSGNFWGLATGGTGGNLKFYNGSGSTFKYTSYPVPLNASDWKNVTAVIDNASPAKVTFYVNGVVDGSSQTLSADVGSTVGLNLRIGADTASNFKFTGDIDDVQIYNTALAATQIRQIYEDRMFASVEPSISSATSTYPIYGNPYIEGFELQPSYTMGTNEVDTSANVRVYGDGKFRNTETAGGTTADLYVIPQGSQTTKWLDITKADDELSLIWEANHKKWKESSIILGETNTLHIVGDLVTGKKYSLTIDTSSPSGKITSTDCTQAGVCTADGTGHITFTYTGGYSDHTFDITDNIAPAFSNISPASGATVSTDDTITFTDSETTSPQCSLDNSHWNNCTTTVTSFHDLTGWSSINEGDTFTLFLKDTDAANNTGTARVDNLTKADESAPVRNGGSPSGNLSSGTTSTTLSLTTSETATCKYSASSGTTYADMTSSLDTTNGTTHTKSISGLTDGNSYNYYVRCEDASHNTNNTDYLISFSVAKPNTNENTDNNTDDDKNLNIHNVKAESTENTITITWKTDYNTKSTIRYGRNKNLSEKKKDNSKEKKHEVILKNLEPNTKYYFRIKATDSDGNEDSGSIHSIVTKSASSQTTNQISNQNQTENQNQPSTTENIQTPSYSGNSTPNACSYIVQSGDTLLTIAKKVYGDATAYPQIIEKNKDKYPDIESKLSIGQELTFCDPVKSPDSDHGASNNQNQPQTKTFRWWNPFSWF